MVAITAKDELVKRYMYLYKNKKLILALCIGRGVEKKSILSRIERTRNLIQKNSICQGNEEISQLLKNLIKEYEQEIYDEKYYLMANVEDSIVSMFEEFLFSDSEMEELALYKHIEAVKKDKNYLDAFGYAIELLEERKISTEECKKIANTYNFPYYETSAKMGIGIDQAFNELISMVYSNLNKKTKIEYTIYKEPSVDIEEHYYAQSTKELKVLIIKIDSEKYENNLYLSLDELILFLQNMKPTQCDINYSKYLTLLFRKIKTISNQSKQNYYYVNTYLQVLVVFPELETPLRIIILPFFINRISLNLYCFLKTRKS